MGFFVSGVWLLGKGGKVGQVLLGSRINWGLAILD